MADKKISALTSLAQGDVAASTDVLPIVDTSATETKKITASALVGAGMTAGVTNVDINSGAIDGTTIGASSAAAGTFTNLTASGTVSFSGATVSNGGAVTTIDINGGTIDATSIGASSASTGSFTTLTTSSTVTLNGGTANGVLYLNGSKVATSGSALTFDGTNLATTGNLDFGTVGAKINFPTTSSVTKNYVGGAADGFSLEMVTQRGAIQPISYKQDYSVGHVWSLTGSGAMALTSTGLGIGTSSPATKLDVDGTGTFKSAGATQSIIVDTSNSAQNYNGLINFKRQGSVKFYAALDSSDNFALLNSSASGLLTLDSAGNLGLGVTPSAWSTSYRAFEFGSGSLMGRSTNTDIYLLSNSYFNTSGNFIYKSSAAAGYYSQAAGAHYWYNAASGTAGGTISFTQAMTLDASARLLVGATSASSGARITLTSAAQASGSACGDSGILLYSTANLATGEYAPFITWSGNATYPNRARAAIGAVSSSTTSALDLVFLTRSAADATEIGTGSERARISSDGTFRVKGAGTAGSTDAFLVDGAAPASAARITSGGEFLVNTANAAGTSGVGVALNPSDQGVRLVSASTTNSTETLSVYSTGATAYRFYVGWGGTVYATNTTISAISDQRFKENISDLDVGLDAVLALKPRKFDWKEGKGKDIKGDRGFIAQEFEQVFPDLVDEWRDPAPEGEEPYKSVRQDLIPVLVKAIQEQQAMIKSLEAKVAALESK
jgi:S-layer protein